MRLLAISDLHFEFHRDGGRAFVEGLSPDGVDVLVLAGDICLAEEIPNTMRMFCERFAHVVYVCGNHEFYNSTREEVLRRCDEASRQSMNLSVLDKQVVEINGTRFVGAPLWFGKSRAPKAGMTDFRVIRGDFTKWVYKESQAAVDFFDQELRPGDVAVSHHLPSYRSVHPIWVGSPMNPFFVREVDDVILRRQPALWIHGHTHVSTDYLLGSTRVVCNPFGYLRHEENRNFDWDFHVEVPSVYPSG